MTNYQYCLNQAVNDAGFALKSLRACLQSDANPLEWEATFPHMQAAQKLYDQLKALQSAVEQTNKEPKP